MLTTLSRKEVERLHAEALLELYHDFEIEVEQFNRGIRLNLKNAPGLAFVDGQMIQGVREQLSAVIRDLVYFDTEIREHPRVNLAETTGITNAVFEILRNADVLLPNTEPDLVVCWGGHSIGRDEYEYTKEVGYHIGLRRLNIITGCGSGAMKGPMKGATIAHAKQRVRNGRYVGITEPGIIAAESPNPIVNQLVILPDIEKRLEAFVRMGHGFVVFPGGAGTAEEILYLLGILLNPENKEIPFPLVLTGPKHSATYFEQIDRFIRLTLGDAAADLCEIVIDDPAYVARRMAEGMDRVRWHRREQRDAYYFNWLLQIREAFQIPFRPTHEAMGGLEIDRSLPLHQLAANLRRVFSGIVAGNVKPGTIRSIREHGVFEIRGEKAIMDSLDGLLTGFVAQHRMKLPGTHYEPCYRIIS
jgi:predicted Rossmann-fold nucleotide-binding protein